MWTVHTMTIRSASDRDQVQTDCLEDYGYTVIRFGHPRRPGKR